MALHAEPREPGEGTGGGTAGRGSPRVGGGGDVQTDKMQDHKAHGVGGPETQTRVGDSETILAFFSSLLLSLPENTWRDELWSCVR